MLRLDQVLEFSHRLPDVPGNNGQLAVWECLDELNHAITTGEMLTLLQGATGCGKSKVLPEQYFKLLQQGPYFHGRRLLVLTTAAKDVESMHDHCEHTKTHWRTGNSKHGGNEWKDAQIIFATVGLFFRWYASNGIHALDDFGAVILDEIGSVERQMDYSLIFEVMRVKQEQDATFKILMCTATMSKRLSDTMDKLNPYIIECFKRPWALERYEKTVDTLELMYNKVAACGLELLKSGRTGLIFLPGEGEIKRVTDMLIALNVTPDKIFPLYSDLDPNKIQAAVRPSSTPRLVLATSIAEVAMTIPDVDVVLDTCVGRWTSSDEIPTSFDYSISQTTMQQREGRVGRTKRGFCFRFVCKDRLPSLAWLDRVS